MHIACFMCYPNEDVVIFSSHEHAPQLSFLFEYVGYLFYQEYRPFSFFH